MLAARRSEEHTSELQSLRHLVCRLLLEKKQQRMPTPSVAPLHLLPARRRREGIGRVGPECFFFFNDTATTEIYTLSLHDALPIFTPRPQPYMQSIKNLYPDSR